jgi:pyruvate ferredoxin oxidoreductase alpha subunit
MASRAQTAASRETEQTVDFLTGNEAAALAAKMARVQVVSAYPITPQTTIVEKLAEYIADGDLEAPCINVEGEHSCMAAIYGASLTGARTFTASSGQGIAYMHEQLFTVHSQRLPVVMAVPNRNLAAHILCDHGDTMAQSTAGWMQLYAENQQEVLDTILQAYKIAEDKRVLMPIMVCYDGFITSHTGATMKVPDQDEVDGFLPSRVNYYDQVNPDEPLVLQIFRYDVMQFEREHDEALQAAKTVIAEVNREYGEIFGRTYGDGLVETVQCEDAEAAILTSHSSAGIARAVVDELRGEGERIGLIRLRSFIPFPQERMRDLLPGFKAVAVLERNETHGSGCGEIYKEMRSAAYDLDSRPRILDFIGGLGGADITIDHVRSVARAALEAVKTGSVEKQVTWLDKL